MTRKKRIRWLLLVLLLQIAVLLCLKSSDELQRLVPSIFHKRPIKPSIPQKIEDGMLAVESLHFSSPDSLKKWEEKIFKGKTDYQLITEKGERYLKGSSSNASSGLYYKFSRTVTPDLELRWEWRALRFPKKKDPQKLANRREDDFSARLYVVFPGTTFFNTNVIEYIWDESLASGTLTQSPFSERIQLFVVRSGPAPAENAWAKETRNLYEDYKKMFGKAPDRAIGAIALMSDSDNTGKESEADFKYIELVTKKPNT